MNDSRANTADDDGRDISQGLGRLVTDEPPFAVDVTESVDSAVRGAGRRRVRYSALAAIGVVVLASGVTVGVTQLLPGGSDTSVVAPAGQDDVADDAVDDEAAAGADKDGMATGEPSTGQSLSDEERQLEALAVDLAQATGREINVVDMTTDGQGVWVGVDIEGYGLAQIGASTNIGPTGEWLEHCSSSTGEVCDEHQVAYLTPPSLDPSPKPTLDFQELLYNAVAETGGIVIRVQNYLGERDGSAAASPPLRELGLDQATLRRVVSESGILPDAEFPAPGPSADQIFGLAGDIAHYASDEAVNIHPDELDNPLYVVTVASGSFVVSVRVEDTSLAEQAQWCAEDIDRTCEEAAEDDGWAAWTRTYDSPNHEGRESLTVAIEFESGALMVEVDNLAEVPPDGVKEVGPTWREVGLTPEVIHQIVVDSGMLD